MSNELSNLTEAKGNNFTEVTQKCIGKIVPAAGPTLGWTMFCVYAGIFAMMVVCCLFVTIKEKVEDTCKDVEIDCERGLADCQRAIKRGRRKGRDISLAETVNPLA